MNWRKCKTTCLLCMLLVLGFYLRSESLWQTVVVPPAIRADAGDYFTYAYNLYHHGVYSRDHRGLTEEGAAEGILPDAVRSPGYPLFLLPFMGGGTIPVIFSHVLFSQVLISTLTVALAYGVYRRFWWTPKDGEEFERRAKVMVEQYNGFSPVDTMKVNGELTIGENIADLGGLTVAYHAYLRSLAGKPAPEIDGFKGEQRVFFGWAQVWCGKYRDDALRMQLVSDPHSPGRYRVNGVMANMPEFYQAFSVGTSDKLFRPDGERVKIW